MYKITRKKANDTDILAWDVCINDVSIGRLNGTFISETSRRWNGIITIKTTDGPIVIEFDHIPSVVKAIAVIKERIAGKELILQRPKSPDYKKTYSVTIPDFVDRSILMSDLMYGPKLGDLNHLNEGGLLMPEDK